MKTFKILSLVAVTASLAVVSLRADTSLLSPRARDLQNRTVAITTDDRIDRSLAGYTGKTPFDSRAANVVVTSSECKVRGTTVL